MENAALGRILGFNTYLDQNVNCVLTGADTNETFLITRAARWPVPQLQPTLAIGITAINVGE